MSIHSTLGAVLAGGLVAVGLSAIVCIQTLVYYLVFPQDTRAYKLIVAWIWVLDATHTVLVCASLWLYLISNFNNTGVVPHIFSPVAINVSLTALITLTVNAFYGWRIFKLSKGNWWVAGPIALLIVARVGTGLATTVEMLREGNFITFGVKFKILFTSGLFLSAVTDIYVSVARYWYLRNLREGYIITREMVDTTLVFTLNDGCLTCVVIIACIACWLGMPHNFIYLGLYFAIAKLYSNSVLATLNLRNWYRHRYNIPRQQRLGIFMAGGGTTSYPLNNIDPSHLPHTSIQTIDERTDVKQSNNGSQGGSPNRLEIIVDRTQHVVSDGELQLFGNPSQQAEKNHTLALSSYNS